MGELHACRSPSCSAPATVEKAGSSSKGVLETRGMIQQPLLNLATHAEKSAGEQRPSPFWSQGGPPELNAAIQALQIRRRQPTIDIHVRFAETIADPEMIRKESQGRVINALTERAVASIG